MKNKNNIVNELFDSCDRLIYLAKQMLRSCQMKRKKVHSPSRYIVSFFFRRSLEMLESFIVLIKACRLIDGAVLLRSLCDMSINLAYILAEPKTKEINALKYMLKGETDQQKLLDENYDWIKKRDSNIDLRKSEIEENIKNIKGELTKKYKVTKWGLPPIKQRAKDSGEIIFNYYTQVYVYYSNIEHHSMFFGQSYVDWDKCEPLKETDKVENSVFFRPEITIYMFRGLFLVALSKFNKEFQLKWGDKISKALKIHASEIKKLRKTSQ